MVDKAVEAVVAVEVVGDGGGGSGGVTTTARSMARASGVRPERGSGGPARAEDRA